MLIVSTCVALSIISFTGSLEAHNPARKRLDGDMMN
jgi:hypothetical protein